MSRELHFILAEEEVNFILNVLGELPTKTGAFPLVMKVKQQAEAQLGGEATEAPEEPAS